MFTFLSFSKWSSFDLPIDLFDLQNSVCQGDQYSDKFNVLRIHLKNCTRAKGTVQNIVTFQLENSVWQHSSVCSFTHHSNHFSNSIQFKDNVVGVLRTISYLCLSILLICWSPANVFLPLLSLFLFDCYSIQICLYINLIFYSLCNHPLHFGAVFPERTQTIRSVDNNFRLTTF